MHTFVELVQDILTALNREDDSVLTNIEDSIELTTTATLPHAVDTYLIYNKTVYKVTAPIATGDTLTPGTNITVANDIMSMISGVTTEIESLSSSKADKSTIAPVESTNTASKAYAVGEQLYYENVLYKVTAAIAQGDTFVVNTNIVAADRVSTQIQALTNQVEDVYEVNGAVNMLPNNATSQTINGITFTVNDDGSVTVNGTATAQTTLKVFTNTEYNLHCVGKRVRLSGCPYGGGAESYSIQGYRVGTTDGSSGNYSDTGDGIEFTWLNDGSGTKAVINIIIRSGYTASNLTFKPMITVASYNGDYVPYAKSNKELTEDVDELRKHVMQITHKSCVTIRTTNALRTQCKIISNAGEVFFAYSGTEWAVTGAVIQNRSSSISTWTYNISGDTIILNSTVKIDGIMVVSNSNIEVTQIADSTPQSTDLPSVNLYNLLS